MTVPPDDVVVGEIGRRVKGQKGPSGYAKMRGKPKIKGRALDPKLSPSDKYVAEARAKGLRHKQIAEELGVPVGSIHGILMKQKVKKRIVDLQQRNEAEVIDLLRTGEVLAADFMNSVLADEEVSPELKFKVAESLLDRMGLRGRPVERKMEQSLTFTGNVDQAVARALADPGVKSWLEAGGLGNLKQLPPAVAEEVIVGSPAVSTQPEEHP